MVSESFLLETFGSLILGIFQSFNNLKLLKKMVQVVVIQMNGADHDSHAIHVLHIGKMRMKLCRANTTLVKEYYSNSMQVFVWPLLDSCCCLPSHLLVQQMLRLFSCVLSDFASEFLNHPSPISVDKFTFIFLA